MTDIRVCKANEVLLCVFVPAFRYKSSLACAHSYRAAAGFSLQSGLFLTVVDK